MKLEQAGLRIRPWGLRTAARDLEGLSDDCVFMIRRAAYVDQIRWVAWRARWMGVATLGVGALMLVWAALNEPGVHSSVAHYAEATIAAASLLMLHVMRQRTRYARAHPFDPGR